jgi:hypothetical protein
MFLCFYKKGRNTMYNPDDPNTTPNFNTPGQPYQPPYQQPQYPPIPPIPPIPPVQPQQQPHQKAWSWYRRQRKPAKWGIGCLALFLVFTMCGVCSNIARGTGAATQANQSTPAVVATATPAATPTPMPTPTPTPKPKPTPTPKPTLTPAQVETTFKQGTTDTTVADIDKNGSAESGKFVHFTASIVNFVKDSSGTTAGANVTDGNGTDIQIAFNPDANINQMNTGDAIEVWGISQGVASGQNAFGATIQESVVGEMYLTDQTSGYQQ